MPTNNDPMAALADQECEECNRQLTIYEESYCFGRCIACHNEEQSDMESWFGEVNE